MTLDEHARRYPTVWRRFNPGETLVRYAWYLGIVIVTAVSFWQLDITWVYLLDAHIQMGDLIFRMYPPDWSEFEAVLDALIETIHIATLGTVATVLIAFPVALLAARNTTFNTLTWSIGRFILVASRSVNTVVWALFFVAIFGPGPVAGIWAIAARSIGFVGKLTAEAIEEIDEGTVEAIEATGASRLQVRESTVLGFVGAGGIGILLYSSINLFQWQGVSVMLIAIFAVVVVSEFVSATVRQRIT
jgi:phosphonate transport system permease protein